MHRASRTTWLDGLRGIAAAIVAANHYFMGGVLDSAFRSYWADPPEDNHRLIQLPPIRLLFAAHAMVPLFLVISGYAISLSLLRAREGGDGAQLLRRLSSAATRRVLRIYLPVLCIAVISQLLFFFDLYQWDFGDDVTWGRRPWTAPWFHVQFVFRYMLDNLNVLSYQGNYGLNGQLWTMVIEFRGSCILYLVILGLAFWRPRPRRWAIVALAIYWFYFGMWDLFAFLAGLFLAELHVSSEASADKTASGGLSWLPPSVRLKGPSVNLAAIRTAFCFAAGIWLICLSDDEALPPGYQFLGYFESSRWDANSAIVNKTWKTLGAILAVYAISKSPALQRPLAQPFVQHLGKVSFSLYLVHQSVYHLIRNPVRDSLWYLATREPYPGADASNRPVPFAFSWIFGFIIISAINMYAAGLYTKHVDDRCIQLAKLFEGWVSI